MKDLSVSLSRLVSLLEMAAPNTAVRAKTYYHGTNKEERGLAIIKDGYLKPGAITQSRSALAPVAGKVYITPHLSYALIYALGGDIAGTNSWGYWMRTKHPSQYGYVFEIPAHNLTDVQPDEDSIGEILYDLMHSNELNRLNKYDETTWKQHWLVQLAKRFLTQNQLRKIYSGEYATWAQAGKNLLKRMNDAQKLDLINYPQVHVAHSGKVEFKRVWRIDKNKAEEFKRDGSNFFEVAELVQ